ncbi:MAG TPA: NUDIX hydrolase [Solirubrobacteraceae bacterium]|jgi:ADP-ribose pyrophosphatase|nr:NUDIX hydrolase [Solirubrobacteraceae bacterium]
MSDASQFEPLGGHNAYEGRLFTVRIERFRYPDGEEVTRDVVHHQGAVGVVAHDDLHLWLVRQPREAVGDPGLLEIPAGRLDVEGESPLEAAQRELAEEIGKSARNWEELGSYYSSPGFTDERVYLYLATGLGDASAQAEDNERIEVVPWPLERLEDAIEASEDAKTLIGLLLLRHRRGG